MKKLCMLAMLALALAVLPAAAGAESVIIWIRTGRNSGLRRTRSSSIPISSMGKAIQYIYSIITGTR